MGMRQEQSSAGAPTLWVVVEDHATKVFDVFGPLGGDVEWNKRVVRAQEQGRNVKIWSVSSEVDLRTIACELAARGFAKSAVAIL